MLPGTTFGDPVPCRSGGIWGGALPRLSASVAGFPSRGFREAGTSTGVDADGDPDDPCGEDGFWEESRYGGWLNPVCCGRPSFGYGSEVDCDPGTGGDCGFEILNGSTMGGS